MTMLLAQLDLIDAGAAKLLALVLGPAGSATVLAFLFRHWFGERLRELERLKRRVQEDRLWKAMARQRFEAQTAEIDRLSRNLHHLKNYVAGLAANVHVVSRRLHDRGVEIELVDMAPPQWEVAQLPPGALPVEALEGDGEEDDS